MGLNTSTLKWPDFRAGGLKGEFLVSSSQGRTRRSSYPAALQRPLTHSYHYHDVNIMRKRFAPQNGLFEKIGNYRWVQVTLVITSTLAFDISTGFPWDCFYPAAGVTLSKISESQACPLQLLNWRRPWEEIYKPDKGVALVLKYPDLLNRPKLGERLLKQLFAES